MKKIALFAYHHPESTLPLVKQFALLHMNVDYFYVTSIGKSESAAFNFDRKTKIPGLWKCNKNKMKKIFDYFEVDSINIFLCVLFPFALRYFKSFSKVQFYFFGFFLKKKKYDYINIIGQDELLLYLYKGLGDTNQIIHSLHEITPHYEGQIVNYSLIEYLYKNRVKIVVHSRESKERFLKLYLYNKISIIPFGVFETYSFFYDKKDPPMIKSKYFLFIGMITEYKGLHTLWNAIEIISEYISDFKVVIAGAGSDKILSKIKQDKKYILINRYIENKEFVNLISNAYCIICPYTSASQSGIVPSAFFFGIPIIASDVGGFKDYINPNQNGLLFDPGNEKELSRLILKLIKESSIIDKLKSGARKFSKLEYFSWEKIALEYIKLMENKSEK